MEEQEGKGFVVLIISINQRKYIKSIFSSIVTKTKVSKTNVSKTNVSKTKRIKLTTYRFIIQVILIDVFDRSSNKFGREVAFQVSRKC